MILVLAGLLLTTREMYTVHKPGFKFYPKSFHVYLAVSARIEILGRWCCWLLSQSLWKALEKGSRIIFQPGWFRSHPSEIYSSAVSIFYHLSLMTKLGCPRCLLSNSACSFADAVKVCFISHSWCRHLRGKQSSWLYNCNGNHTHHKNIHKLTRCLCFHIILIG